MINFHLIHLSTILEKLKISLLNLMSSIPSLMITTSIFDISLSYIDVYTDTDVFWTLTHTFNARDVLTS